MMRDDPLANTNDERIDPVLVAVIGNRFDAVTREMGETMLRTSRSPVFAEARDFVTSLFDGDCGLIAQTLYNPALYGSTPFGQRAIADAFVGDINEGDVFILNDPFRGNNHPPDVNICKPVFWNGGLKFWVMAKGHQADIGGGGVTGYNPLARDVWEEGLRIPPAKLVDRGRLRHDLWEMILMNVRLRFLVEGDLSCQMGAATLGERGVLALLEEFGAPVLDAAVAALNTASERQMRADIANIPDGIYEAEREIDHNGFARNRMLKVKVAITVTGEDIAFDLAGSDDQALGFMNSSYANTVASVHQALCTAINSGVRYNDGAVRPIAVSAPAGSIVNAKEPAATTGCTVPTLEAIQDAVWLALADAIPDLVPAGWARWYAPATGGLNPRTGRHFAEIHFMAKGGGGATRGYDGWDHIAPPVALGGLRAPDPELHELVDPYLVLECQYLPDSAGAGEWRGGLGVRYRWRVLADDIRLASFGSGLRDSTAPFGLAGGLGAAPNSAIIHRADGTSEVLDTNAMGTLGAGDEVEISATGGGGFGDPRRRPVDKVLADVRDGVVSEKRAREDYGVIIDPESGEVDEAATRAARAARAST